MRIHRSDVEDIVVVPLRTDRSYDLGRVGGGADILFSSDRVSRHHGMFCFKDERYWVFRDLGSVNGSFVATGTDEARKVEHGQEVRVRAGDVIRLAKFDAGDWVELAAADVHELTASPGWRSKASRQLEEFISISANHQLAIVLVGDSGTGKTWVARQIHDRSGTQGNFALINCGGLSSDPTELKSELLGHVKGAYTGAIGDRVGKLIHAENGTVFLDEVESMPRVAQDFLIDVLDRKPEVAPLGAPPTAMRPLPRFRLISASKLPLEKTSLRRDLVQRLAVGQGCKLPRLEDRAEDIPALVAGFVEESAAAWGIRGTIATDALKHLASQRWPGQLRELRATVDALLQTAAAKAKLAGNPTNNVKVSLADLREYVEQRAEVLGQPEESRSVPPPPTVMAELPPSAPRKRPGDLSAEEIRDALKRNAGKKQRTADDLGIALNTLKAHMKRFGIEG